MKNSHLVPPVVRLTPEDEVQLRALLAAAPALLKLAADLAPTDPPEAADVLRPTPGTATPPSPK